MSPTGSIVVGDQISYTITATNTGNITLKNVAISDHNGVLGVCVPTDPLPGHPAPPPLVNRQ